MAKTKALTVSSEVLTVALINAIAAWADARTDANSARRLDLLRDKTRAVTLFFEWTRKPPWQVTAIDVKAWQAELEGRGLSPATVYAMISRISSFYNWAREDPDLAEQIHNNPVTLARPKAPKAYQNEAAQALDDDEAAALLREVKRRADAGDVVAKRDYALLLFYFGTGMRRREVTQLRWGNVKLVDGAIRLVGKVKGGDYVGREITDPRVKTALLDYLQAAGRLDEMAPESPLWTSHDRANVHPNEALTSHAVSKRFKRYARAAGLPSFHMHQTRHTFARWVGESTGSIVETQDALGHKNAATTRVYVRRIAVKKDKHSTTVLDKLGV